MTLTTRFIPTTRSTPALLQASGRISVLCLSALVGFGCAVSEDDDINAIDGEVVVCADGPTVEGIDVSYWQSTIDWNAVATSDVEWGIARASDGVTYNDSRFEQNWVGMKNAGLVRGVYQFFRPAQDPIAQANLMLDKLAAAGGLEAGDLPPVLDIEVTDGVASSTIVTRMNQWLAHVEQATGRKPIIYTSIGAWGNIGSPAGFDAYPLWVANYGVSCPSVPNGSWSGWDMWQYSSTGRVPGIAGDVDRNVFNGTLDDLLRFAGGDGGVDPRPSDLVSLGGNLGDEPAVARNADGRLQVFAAGADGALMTNFQIIPNGGWSTWDSLGGVIHGRPAVSNAADGRLELFVRGVDNAIWRKSQTAPGAGFGDWQPLGGTGITDPVAVTNWDQRIELFVVGTDGRLYHRWQTSQNSSFSGWTSRGSLVGGGLTDIVAVADRRQLPVVVGRGNDGRAYAIRLTLSGWTEWQPIGGAGTIDGRPTIGINQDGRLEVFARGSAGDLVHTWENSVEGSWSSWYSEGGGVFDPFVAPSANGRLTVFVRGLENQLYRKTQVAPNSSWGGWTPMGGSFDGGAMASRNQDGRIEVFVTSRSGAMLHAWQSEPGTW